MQFTWVDAGLITRLLLDILVVWALIYYGIQIMRGNSRTYQIVKGLLAVFLVKLAAGVCHLNALNDLLNIFLNWGVIFVLIILQPEIRGMLEKVGKTTPESMGYSSANTPQIIDSLISAVTDMSETKTGALITLQMKQSLQDYSETGIEMDCDISREVLETIFQYGTPLHDGAVIIKDGRIECAAAYFPPTGKDLPSRYGARHRAAVGISEVTDSLTLVVSEETGNISVAQRGVLTQYSPEALRRLLVNRLMPDNPAKAQSAGSIFSGGTNPFRSFASSFAQRKNGEPLVKKKVDDRVEPVEVKDMRPEETPDQSQTDAPVSQPIDVDFKEKDQKNG